jgi:hypothetical protein
VREARPLTLEIDIDKKQALSALFYARDNCPSCFWRIPEIVSSLGTVIGTLRMASEAKVWKLSAGGARGQAESGARYYGPGRPVALHCQSRYFAT